MADIRISGQDLRKIEQVQRGLTQAIQKVDARQLERIGTDVAGRINAGVQRLLADIEKIQERFGITDPRSQRALRSGLEAAEGATGAVKGLAPFAALLANSPQARIALLAGAAVLGGLEGLGRDGLRRAAVDARRAEIDIADRTWARLNELDREIARLKAAKKRAARVR